MRKEKMIRNKVIYSQLALLQETVFGLPQDEQIRSLKSHMDRALSQVMQELTRQNDRLSVRATLIENDLATISKILEIVINKLTVLAK